MNQTPTPLLHCDNATKNRGSQLLWSKVNLTVYPGEFIVIIGENGTGKSTLLHCLLGLEKIQHGTITTHATTSIITQITPEVPLFPLTGRQFVTISCSPRLPFLTSRAKRQTFTHRVDQALEMTGAKNFSNTRIDQLSGGQWQRIRIASSLVNQPQLLYCDEPLTGLDRTSIHTIIDKLHSWQQKSNAGIIMVSHDLACILPIAHRVLLLAHHTLTEIPLQQAMEYV